MDILEFLKFLGIFVSFVAGVMATAFETKDDRTKRLNMPGKLLLGFIVLGAFTSGITQYLDDSQATKQRISDLKRLNFIVTNAERLSNPFNPLSWRVVVRYRLESKSVLLSYIQMIQRKYPGLTGFDMGDAYMPRRYDPLEKQAWDYLEKPKVYIAILGRELYVHVKSLPLPIAEHLPVLLEAPEHSDQNGTWKSGPDAALPSFYSRMSLTQQDGSHWLQQEFVIRSSPQAVHTSGVIISPVDLSGYLAVAETPPDLIVDRVVLEFPTGEISLALTPVQPTNGANRALAVIDPKILQKVFGLPNDIPN